jgi:plasmid maintenance system antidote protein VapI
VSGEVLTLPLEDSIELEALAKAAGITRVEAKRVLALLADIPIRRAIRMAKTCQAEAERARERAKRLRR